MSAPSSDPGSSADRQKGRQNVRLAAAVVVPFLACAVQGIFWEYFQPYVWFLFFPTAYFCAYFGGLRGGLISTVISALLVWYVFIPPQFSFELPRTSSLFSIVVYVIMGTLFGVAHERHGRARRLSAEAQALAEQRAREAEAANRRAAEEVATRVRLENDAEKNSLELAERQAHEREIERWTRLYAALSQINQAVVRMKTIEDLAREVSRAAVEAGGFKLAWIGQHHAQIRVVVPLGCAGEPQEFIHRFRHGSNADASHRCPCGHAIRNDRAYVVNQLSGEPEMRDWHAEMESAGIRAAAVFPIRVQGAVWGLFGVYAEEPEVFQDKETALLEQAAMDIGYAVENLENETRRQHAVEALRQSEARLRLSVAAADIGLWDWDLATNQVIFSPEWKRQIGYGDDEIPNRFEEWQSRVHPDDVGPMLQKIRAFLATPQGRHMGEFRFRHKDGSYRWIYTHADLVRDASGQPARMLGCHIDITDRKEAEADLVRMRNTLLEAQGIAHLGSFEYVAATRTTVWSEEEYRIYGLDPAGPSPAYDEMLARCIHPEDAALLHEAFTKAMAGQTVYELEHRIVRPDGSVRWVHDRAHPYFDPQGQLVRYVGTTLDITERKRIAEQLLESEQKYTVLFQKSSTPTVLLKLPEVVIVDINESCERLLGLTRQEVAGKTAIELGLTKKENRQEAISRFIRHGTLDGHEMHLVTRSGVERIVVSNTNRVTIAGTPYAITTLQDFTALRHAEAALRRSEAHLRTLVKTLPDLVWVKDPAGVYLACNTRFEVLFGAAETAIVGKTDYDFVPREVADAFRRNDAAALAAGRPRINEEEVVFASDGHRELLETIKTPLHDADGTLIGVLGIARDITARKRAEDALRESEARRALALDAAKAGTWEWELASGRNVWSEELWKLYGLEPHFCEPSYEAWRRTVHPDDRSKLEQSLQVAVQREADISIEWRVHGSGTSPRWLMSRGRPRRDAAGKVTHYVGVVFDITERKHAEDEIRESQVRRTLALDAAKAGIWEWDLASGRNLWSEEIWKLYGLEPHSCEPSYEAWRESVAPEDRPLMEKALQEAVRSESEINLEWRVHEPDEATRWLMSRGRPQRDDTGRVIRYLGVVIDITERRQAEERARQSTARLDFALQASHTGAWSLNTRDRTATRTLLHAQIFGYPSADGEWSQEKFLAHVVPDDREAVRQRVQEGLATRSGWSFECRIRRADGELRWVLIAGGFEPEGSDARVSGIIQDITERKQLEQQRLVMEAQLRQQQKLESIGTLASGVAHEINNPITGIMNYAQLIQDRLPAASPLTEFTGEILRETHRVATIVRNLLTFARNERQSHSPARLIDIVEAVLSLVRTVIRRDHIVLQMNVPEDLPSFKCRSQQIQQVIMNLVTNARDALNERFPESDPDKVLNLEARLFEKAGRRWIRLTVEDHGTGIAPEIRERMFDPFFTTKGREAGTGLGLSISHGIVKEHHGVWTVDTEPGRFTRMHIDLPVDNGWDLK
ncbi:MAG: PAS domain-containing protein [Verrucomicrobia bacterium]|nr:PAS domain-containing protein [Verrucomicrobiota bacterium]